MAIFDFITNDDFRQSLDSDYQEMILCFNAKAWKAVHVLAGSIIEAILIDYIIAEQIVSRDDALKMDFGNAITLCKEKKIISSRTSDLSSVVKSYRNLIHPGRIIRLNENINRDSAEVAKALVSIVVEEIEKQKRDKYGYTAEQIIGKIRRDSSVDTIIAHIIKHANPIEVEKLLLKVLPNAYMEYIQEFEEIKHLPSSFSICFRTAFDQANDILKERVAENFVRIINEESDQFIFSYGQLFFRASDLIYLPQEDLDITKKYLLKRLDSDTEKWLSTISGMGKFLSKDDISKFIDPLIRSINSREDELSEDARKRLVEEFGTSTDDIQQLVLDRLNDWLNFYHRKSITKYVEKIEGLKAELVDIISF